MSPQLSIDASSDVVSLRNFLVDEDRANLGSALWKTIDKNAFIQAQQEALDTYRIAKAIKLSEETAVLEGRQRAESSAATVQPKASPCDSSASSSQSAPTPNQRIHSPPASDEAAARSLARSWKVEGLQTTLLENRGQLHPPSSFKSKPSSSSTQPQPPHHDRRPSVSKASTSQNVSLSTPTFASSSSSASTVVAASDSAHLSSRTITMNHTSVNIVQPSSSRSRSQSHSRPPLAQIQPSQVQSRLEPRPISKRDLATVDGPVSVSPPSSASRSIPTRASSSVAAAEPTQQKRQRNPSISVPQSQSQPQYSYSTTNYSYYYAYNGSNGNTTIAPPMSETKKPTSSSSTSSRDIQAGQILNPTNSGSSSSSGSSSYPSTAPSSASASKEPSPKISTMALPFSTGVSSASAQAAAAEREKERRSDSKRRASVLVQESYPRDIFGPVRFNCSKCGSVVVTAVQTQVSTATSPILFVLNLVSSPRWY